MKSNKKIDNERKDIIDLISERRDEWKRKCEEAEAKIATMDDKAIKALDIEYRKINNLHIYYKSKAEHYQKEVETGKERIAALSEMISVLKVRLNRITSYFNPLNKQND